jgi:hypothetical protein
MNAERNPMYLRSLAGAVREFKAALQSFLDLHVLTEGMGFGRGLVPAVSPRDDADPEEIGRRKSVVAQAAGRMAAVPLLTGIYVQVQGLPGPIDPFAAWHSMTRPRPILEPGDVLDACDQAIGRLEGLAIKAEAERPPKIGVTSMHPLIWGAAGPLWRDGHYRPAVVAAAEALVAQVKARTARNDVPETGLWQEVFSEKPPLQGKPRLRWPGQASDRAVKNMNDGLRLLAPGVQMTIRNSTTHTTEDLSEQAALERLAALSLLAGWVGECELDEAPAATDLALRQDCR